MRGWKDLEQLLALPEIPISDQVKEIWPRSKDVNRFSDAEVSVIILILMEPKNQTSWILKQDF